MEIRVLEPKDAALYREIRLEALKNHPEAFSSGYEEEKEFSLAKTETRLGGGNFFTFGAFEQNELLGVVTLIVESKLKIKHRANIVAMYVKRKRLGIGKRLMLEAIKKARELEGIEQVYLTVTSSNEPAKRLYQSLGFETYGLDKRALKIGDDYYDDELMVLFL
ncbi:GNAT family N-acetyltransferase [Cytobacillus sp. FJAT-54145]|uniref:GNAT family N-acetyltransferase n=1 Tax=Cytobacillus spartinae TaxID=3299023 RepID=A0ABW6K655_9BACI